MRPTQINGWDPAAAPSVDALPDDRNDVDAAIDAKALRKALEMIQATEIDPPDVAQFERLLVGNLARMARPYRDEAGVRSHGSGAIWRLGVDLDRHWKECRSGFSDL